MTDSDLIAEVEGPRGKAQIFEEMNAATRTIDYTVEFNGQRTTFGTMGEAYIEAGDCTGTKL